MVPNNTIVVAGIGSLPDDWRLFVANDVSIKITKGTTPPKSEISNSGKIPFLRVNNLSFNGCLKKDSDFIFVSEESHVNFLSRSRAYPDDILMNIVGPPLGKVTRLDNAYSEYNLNQAIVFYRLNTDMVDAGFFTSYLGSSRAQDWLQSRSKKTSGQQNLTIEICKQLPVPVPLLSEQKKIAEILSTWDQAISTAEQLLDNSQRQKKALMQQLLTGKKRLLDNNGVRFSGEWKKCTLGKLGDTFNGLTGKTKDDFGFGKKYIPYINIFKNSRIDVNALELVDVKEGESQSLSQYGDIFFTTSSETPDEVGMSSVLLDHVDELYLNSFCFGYRLFGFESLQPEYARYLLRSEHVRGEIAVLGQGATRYNLSKKQLMKLELTLPPIDEQKKIASVLSSADQEIETLQSQLNGLKQEKKALMQALLTGKRRVQL